MRTIKFRGKDKATGAWVYGDLTRRAARGDTEFYILWLNGYGMTESLVHELTVGQFTGLVDVKNKEIYEGDVLSMIYNNGEAYEAVCEVIFDAPIFCLKMLRGNEKAMRDVGGQAMCFGHIDIGIGKLRRGEIVGNVHDNKAEEAQGARP